MEEFNPYHEWLGLDRRVREPTYYELLGLRGDESPADIAVAAVAAMCRVRKCRPGARLAQWATLFDEVVAAKKCLCDPRRRAAYDQGLQPRGPSPALVAEPPARSAGTNNVRRESRTVKVSSLPSPRPQGVDVIRSPAPHLSRQRPGDVAPPCPARPKWLAFALSVVSAFAGRFLISAP